VTDDKDTERMRKYRKENREAYNQYYRDYYHEVIKNDPARLERKREAQRRYKASKKGKHGNA
jgi:hypothetical protein